jgi:hypothetical protein
MNTWTCDRCKRKAIKQWNFPHDWGMANECGDLCPKCYKLLQAIRFDSAEKYKSDIAIFNRNETP